MCSTPLASAYQKKVTGILLAAGLSTRMGEPKQLLPFGDNTIVETAVDNMLGANFDEVIVVVGHHASEVEKQLGTRPIKTVFNPNYREGMLTSAQIGIRALEASDAFALMLVDQPFITSTLIDQVVDAYQRTEKGIALPSYNYKRGHPVIFDQKYAIDILALTPESDGVRTLFKKYGDDIHYVTVDTDSVLRDIDYREDYERALKEK
ncbi:nucleotidyltransferase family protein [Candidatus Poribacteria bacterium]|nr:nucleotidyltransferase family protein [Candidatus Poribacteria bacterium]MYH84040.1 nucleotidyltransferase family protein [Candidatus Poribacteria bacterium]MYK96074.1 nucleotidyltransferase family protein [Candidatus Poribacteria bacterium]